jgi:hypothetical protein
MVYCNFIPCVRLRESINSLRLLIYYSKHLIPGLDSFSLIPGPGVAIHSLGHLTSTFGAEDSLQRPWDMNCISQLGLYHFISGRLI